MVMIADVILILAGLFVGWTIGANDAGNCMGASVGAGLLTPKKAVLFVAFFAMLGVIIEGETTVKTIGTTIVNANVLTHEHIAIALLSAASVITVLTIFSIPISSTQAVLGAIAGLGIIAHNEVHYGELIRILGYGFLTPGVTALGAYLFQRFIIPLILNTDTFLRQERVMKFLLFVSGAFIAYSLGANNVGNAVGLAVGKGILTPLFGGLLGGLAISLGAATFGTRVMRSVGSEITSLDATMALSAQISAATVVYAFTLHGIPTSLTFSVIGAIVGVGIVKGMASLQTKTITTVATAWLLTPIASMMATVLFATLYGVVFP